MFVLISHLTRSDFRLTSADSSSRLGGLQMRLFLRHAITAASVAAGYYACAAIGTVLSVPPYGFAIIWPATAFLIAVLLILPMQRWWLCAAGVIPAHFHLAAILQPEAPTAVVLTQIGGNLGLAVATVVVVRKVIARQLLFDSFASVLKFVLLAGIAVPAVVNALVLSVHVATGWADDLWLSWRQWMIAGIFPTITIPPLLVLLAEGKVTGLAAPARRTLLELTLLLSFVFATSFLAFSGAVDGGRWPAIFLAPFPFLLWAAVRLGIGGTALSLLVFATSVIAQALRHNGPFTAQAPIDDVISLQAFLITVSVPLMLLAALTEERRRTAGLLKQSETRMEMAASSTDTCLWQWDAQAEQLWLTPNCEAMLGLKPTANARPDLFLAAVHPEDRTRVGQALQAAVTAGSLCSKVEFRRPDDSGPGWLLMETRTELDDAGEVICVSGVFRDVSERVQAELLADDLRRRLTHIREDERRRIADELHDSTAQHLIAADLHLLNLKAGLPDGSTSLVEEIQRSVVEAATEIRAFSYLLHPPHLDEQGLRSVLERYIPGFERRTGIATSLRLSPCVEGLPIETQHAVFRIVQESLSNVHRHARAACAAVDVRCLSGRVHTVITDSGEGIRPEAGERLGERLRLGVGIPAMTARVRQSRYRYGADRGTIGTIVHVAIARSTDDPAIANS